MKQQAFNPYLPSYEYVPDGEPHVFDGRVYVYGSHDKFDGGAFCMNDYVCWSAPVDDLGDWRYEGVIYKKTQEPTNADGARNLFAPDVARGPDGRYYLYYAMMAVVSVAVCDTPAGKYEFYGYVQHLDGTLLGRNVGDNINFDPGILVDDDERVYLYSGVVSEEGIRKQIKESGFIVDGSYCIELESDMKTVKFPPKLVIPFEGSGFEGHEFYEASSIRKIQDKYYFVYSSQNGHELCYATGDKPDEIFTYGGTLVSNGDIYLHGKTAEQATNYTGNTHGGILDINGQLYIFYHRQTNRHHFSRQGCAEPICLGENGFIPQVEMTSCGLNGGPLQGTGEYGFYIACNILSKDGTCFYPDQKNQKMAPGIHPYFTQDKPDGATDSRQYIANFSDGAKAGFKYFAFDKTSLLTVKARGSGVGELKVYTDFEMEGNPVACVEIKPVTEWQEFTSKLDIESGIAALFFTFKGEGTLDLLSFVLA